MTAVLAHIGMNKAGSTAIQVSLGRFDDGRIRYARLGRANHSLAVVATFCGTPRQNGLLRRTFGDDRTALEEARAAGEAALRHEVALGRHLLLLSGEGIGHLGAADIERMATFFEGLGCPFRVLAYIREPIGFASSAFQQRVKAGRAVFRIDRPQYRKEFAPFIDVLGREAVTFCAFRREALAGGSVVSDFACHAGIDPAKVEEVRPNPSLSAAAVALLFQWNKAGRDDAARMPEGHRGRRLLEAALATRFPGTFHLSPGIVRAGVDMADLAWMEEASGLDLCFAFPDGSGEAGEDGSEPGAVASAADLAALADTALPDLAELLAGNGLEPPRQRTPAAMMQRLHRHFMRKARSQPVRRGSAPNAKTHRQAS